MSNIKNVAMITVCGRPNVGKSSLTNALVGEKVAIVSNKAQTTRNRIYGIVNRDDTQFILLDTPGLHRPKSALGDYMVKVVTSSLADVDCALLLVEPIAHVGAPELALIERIRNLCRAGTETNRSGNLAGFQCFVIICSCFDLFIHLIRNRLCRLDLNSQIGKFCINLRQPGIHDLIQLFQVIRGQ